MKPLSWAISKADLNVLQAKFNRGSHGGKQMAKLSSKESVYLVNLIDCLYQDYPDWIESTLK